jgi:hypothetical protein
VYKKTLNRERKSDGLRGGSIRLTGKGLRPSPDLESRLRPRRFFGYRVRTSLRRYQPRMDTFEQLLNPEEAASLLGIHPKTLIKMARESGGKYASGVAAKAEPESRVSVPANGLMREALVTQPGQGTTGTVDLSLAKARIDDLGRNKGREKLASFEVDEAVIDLVWEELTARGEVFWNGRTGYVFWRESRVLYEISPNTDFLLLLSHFGLRPEDKITKQVWRTLAPRAKEFGTRTEVHRLSYFGHAERGRKRDL